MGKGRTNGRGGRGKCRQEKGVAREKKGWKGGLESRRLAERNQETKLARRKNSDRPNNEGPGSQHRRKKLGCIKNLQHQNKERGYGKKKGTLVRTTCSGKG